MPILINITGPMAVGKTTICSILRKELKDFAFVDREYMKRMLKKTGKPEAKKIVNAATIFIIKKLMKLGKNVLVTEQSISQLKIKLKNYSKDYNIYSYFLYCSVDEALKRDKERDFNKQNPKAVRKIHERVKPSKEDILVNTEDTPIENTIEIILRKIRGG